MRGGRCCVVVTNLGLQELNPKLRLCPCCDRAVTVLCLRCDQFKFGASGVQPEAPAAATGWSHYADSKDKLGLIATSPWSHISVRLALGADTKVARLTVGYLRSYDNVSAVGYWVDEKPGLEPRSADTANPAKCDPVFAAGLDWLDPYGAHK